MEHFNTLARETPLDELPGLIGALAEAQAVALARLVTPQHVATCEPDEWLTTDEVAALLKIAPKAVRRLAAIRPYRSTALGPKTIRYSRAGVTRLIKRRAA